MSGTFLTSGLPWKSIWYVTLLLSIGAVMYRLGGPEAATAIAQQIHPAATRGPSDFYQYWAAARDWREGRSLYSDLQATFPEHAHFLGPGASLTADQVLHINAYPPFATLFFAPFSYLDYSTGYSAWIALSLAMALASIVLIGRELWPGSVRKQLGWCVLAVVLVGTSPTLKHEVGAGNVGCLLLFLLTLTWLATRRGYAVAAGVVAGVALHIKLFPGLLLVYFLWTNRRSFVTMVVTSVLLAGLCVLVFGLHEVLQFREALSQSRRWYAWIFNHAIFGVWYRQYVGSGPNASATNPDDPLIIPLDDSPGLATVGAYASVLLVGLLIFQKGIYITPRQESQDFYFAAMILGMIVMSPLAWPATLLLAVLPIGILWKCIGETYWGSGLLTGCIVMLWLHPLTWARFLHTPDTGYQPWENLTYLSLKTYVLVALLELSLVTSVLGTRPAQPRD